VGELSTVGADVSVATGALVAASVGRVDVIAGASASVGWETGTAVAGLAQADNNPTSKSSNTFIFLETIR
jgi:hypothetical protein